MPLSERYWVNGIFSKLQELIFNQKKKKKKFLIQYKKFLDSINIKKKKK